MTARRQLTSLDLTGLPLLNLKIENLAADPASPHGGGHVYYNTVENKLKVFNGTAFEIVGKGSVTEVSSANADISVAMGTSTPILTLNSSKNADANTIAKRDSEGNLFATNLSGSNTGDQTITLTGEASGSGMGTFDVTLTNAAVIAKVLTGLSTAVGGSVSAADSILAAIGKLENRTAINDAKIGITPLTAAMAMATDATGMPVASTTTAAELAFVHGVTSSIQTQLNGKEPTLTAGTVTDYYRGDKTWQALNTTAVAEGTNLYFTADRTRGTVLTGFDATQTGIISASDSILVALGKAQHQINAVAGVAHTQNTDLGTSNPTFYIGTTGPLWKNNGGVMELRNTGDTDYADLHVKNLTVQGSLTQIDSTQVNIADTELVLNYGTTTAVGNSDGGIAIKRLMADNTTEANAKILWNESAKRWNFTFGPTTGLVTRPAALRFDALVGDGTNTSFVITHNFGTKFVVVSIADATTGEIVDVAIPSTTDNTITVDFAEAPATDAYRVTVIG